jgi:hypothetical protein
MFIFNEMTLLIKDALIQKYKDDENKTKIIEYVCQKITCSKYPTIYEEMDICFQTQNKMYRRLECIFIQHDTAFDFVPDKVQSWTEFCAKNPAWASPDSSYVTFRDDPRYNGKCALKQRVQHSALCYIHAPSILLYYLYKRSHPDFNQVIDISKFVQNNLNPDSLYYHLFGDLGGDSLDLLRILTKHKVKIQYVNLEDITSDFLKKYGPLLAHSFLVYDDLFDKNISSHDETTFIPTLAKESFSSAPIVKLTKQVSLTNLLSENVFADAKGNASSATASPPPTPQIPDKKHALVLVGIRKQDADTYLLFQNWWAEKQFFEANLWYLDKCELAINYVINDINDIIKTDFICGEFFETCCDFSNQHINEIHSGR